MVRIAFLLFFALVVAQATPLGEKIESFIGEKEYKVQKNLIRILFKNESQFLYGNSKVNDMKVLEQLKKSGLLKLFYKNPQELNLSFFTKENSLIFMRVINETLSSMGYNYFLTKRALKNEDLDNSKIVATVKSFAYTLFAYGRIESIFNLSSEVFLVYLKILLSI